MRADLHHMTIEEAADAMSSGQLSSVELTESVLARVESVEDRYKAYITVDADGAMEQARRADEMRAGGRATAVTGVPVCIKDNIVTRGLRTTCASKLLEDFVPPFDATIIAKLRQAGAVIVGKTNLDEFAMGSSTENSGFFTSRNPWDVSRVPGGSSGGSAVAPAYGGCIFAIGEDTGGSIRQPASFCGIVGCKPTYGRVSRWGSVAMASSLDQIGPMCKTVRDAAIALRVIAGHEPKDATSSTRPVPDYLDGIEGGVEGLKIGYVPSLLDTEGIHPGVVEVTENARKAYEDLGAEIVNVELPNLKYSISTYYILCPSEVSANMARFDGIRYGVEHRGEDMWGTYARTRGLGFGQEVKRRIIIGAFALSAGYYDAYYQKAAKVRTLIARDFSEALDKCDAILMPVTPFPAFKIGEFIDNTLRLYLADIFTLGLNLAGLPGLCVPAGTVDNMPQGVQLVGRAYDEKILFQAGRAFERRSAHSLAHRLAASKEKLP